MSVLKTVFFNGRFLNAKQTGVQRVARELIVAADRQLAQDAERLGISAELLVPGGVSNPPQLGTVRLKPVGRRQGIGWEQLDFAAFAKKGLLVNLCNVGPALTRNAITMIHDAQVFTSPGSYSFAFRTYYRLFLPWLGLRHRLILTVSEFSKQELVKYKIAPAKKIRVVPNGVDHVLRFDADLSRVKQLGLEPQGYVLSLANLQKHKNIKILLEAFQSQALKGLKLVLFGGVTRDELTQHFGAMLPDNVILTSKVSDEELRGLVEQALCLAFPSTTEGFGLPPLEAMLLGCPAIVAPCGALPEVCGDAALYAEPDKAEAWVAAVLKLDGSPELRANLSEKSRAQAGKYSWASAAKILVGVVDEALGRK